jgi:hypothetical protein
MAKWTEGQMSSPAAVFKPTLACLAACLAACLSGSLPDRPTALSLCAHLPKPIPGSLFYLGYQVESNPRLALFTSSHILLALHYIHTVIYNPNHGATNHYIYFTNKIFAL